MARRFRCPRPINRLVMHRAKGLSGPFFQNVGDGCVKGMGNAYGIGGPLAGPKAVRGEVDVAVPTKIDIFWTQCVELGGVPCPNAYGMVVEIGDPGVPTTIEGAVLDPTGKIMTLTVPEINPGETVTWYYTEGDPACILDCEDQEGVGDQGPLNITNNTVLAGDFVLLETGGMDVILLENDDGVGDDEAILLETADAGLGPELITNGTFDTDLSGWTYATNWRWANQEAESFDDAGADNFQQTGFPLDAGKTYRVSFTINTVAGALSVRFGSTSGAGEIGLYSTSGSYQVDTQPLGGLTLGLNFHGRYLGTLDNVSVREVL